MIGLDTNVVVRYLAQDDPKQSPKATALIESLTQEMPGYITIVALVEIVWVLIGRYVTTKQDLIKILETLLRTNEIVVERSETVWKALHLYAGSKADFADCLIERLGRDAQCDHTVTFDVVAAKAAGMRLIA